ncbi:MAG: hypothetical protein K2K45_06940 [Muribaculaceae bacterium]|nr:hypothetical protein [Muribaculaceae bacterium]
MQKPDGCHAQDSGWENPVSNIGFNIALLILQADGMIEPIEKSDKLQTVRLSAKGHEFLQRGGYSEFV